MTWHSVRDGWWEHDDGRRVRRVSPRGLTLYALTVPGARRPTWYVTLEEAKRAR
jgi:hypothetical protein